jgi:predicted RNase H-like nuclease (RuvC/YqgF family)
MAAKDAQIVQLRAEVRALSAKLTASEAEKEAARTAALTAEAELAEDCEECMDLAAIDQEVADANCDLLEAQRKLRDEVRSTKWCNKFRCDGLEDVLCTVDQMMWATVCERDYRLAIACHNAAYCRAKNAPEYIAERKVVLEDYLATHPDLDERCATFIRQALLISCA